MDSKPKETIKSDIELSGMSLNYWKTRLEVMETQKQDLRQWMAETTLKIAESVKRMKLVTERFHKEFIEGNSLEKVILKYY